MTIFILRHADKQSGDFYNPQLRHQDQPISAFGEQQAEALVPFFSKKNISNIYVSDYLRTQQTIAPVAERLRLPLAVDGRLNEFDNGGWDGLSEPEISAKFPDVWRAYLERATDFRFPDGETGEEAQQRIVNFLEDHQALDKSENIIAVTHEGLVKVMMCWLMRLPVYKHWNFQVDTCGITEVVYQPEHSEWRLIRFNQTCLEQ
jgi:broad specificity phosphatase PhoE